MDFKKQLIINYDADARRRDFTEDKLEPWKVDIRQRFAMLLTKEGKKKILEIGSGAGFDAEYFQKQGFEVLATDFSKEMIKRCQKRKLKTKVFDFYNLAELGETFDAIYSMNALLHVPEKDLKKVLKIISSTLNPTGIFYYGVYGGKDAEEIIADENKTNLPRFFSFLADKTLLDIVKDYFAIIDFRVIPTAAATSSWFHFQSLLLRKR